MPERVALAFSAYVQMGHRRSLERLVFLCREIGVKAASATLRRWSVRYEWQLLLQQHDRRRVAEIEASLAHDHSRMVERDAYGLRAVQDRFLSRLLIDPDDPSLTRAQRRRAMNPTFRDFRKAVELERMLLHTAEPAQRRRRHDD